MLKETLLGYDLRIKPEYYLDDYWTYDKRRESLIDPNLGWPISIDTSVWPSVFKYSGFNGSYIFVNSMDHILNIEVEPLNVDHYKLCLWPNSSLMIKSAEEKGQLTKVVPVAFSIVGEDQLIRADSFWSEISIIKEAKKLEKEYNFDLIGLDVADREFTSALSNCGYKGKARGNVEKEWKQHLNNYGLFSDYEHAASFALRSNDRINEHAPFFVYSLYWLVNEKKANSNQD